jgi:hypothetical protein
MVRVLRLLEYVYADHEAAEKDMQNWKVPADGTVKKGGGVYKSYLISSTTMMPRTVEEGTIRPMDFYHGG